MSTMNRLACLALFACAVASAELPAQGADKHMGVATCAASQCHGSAAPRDSSAVMQNEYVTWTRDDPHARAYATLSSDASRAIAARLGIGPATAAKICLDCHADNVAAARRGEKFQLSDGVGCEACHGGAERWLSTHYNTPAVDHTASLAAGLYATEDPAARAQLCLSCHLGTADKFATHRIMAAGHPRLSFELDTFTELWRTAGRQPHYRVDADYAARKDTYRHSYTWAVGVIAEARARMRLVLHRGFDSGAMFPELGLYDCHACHRSMKSVQWRRLPRHGDAAPGLPYLNDGALVMSMALARVIDAQLASDFQQRLAELHTSGSRDVESIRAAARRLLEALERLERQLGPGTLANRESQLLRELLATGAEGNYIDYVSAEQAFMAVQMLVFEIGNAAMKDRLDALGDALTDDERYSPARFKALLAELGE